MGLRQVSAPAVEPVTLVEAKAHLRVAHTDDDGYITTLISVARSFCEADMMRAIATQSWLVTLDAFPSSGAIRLDFGPVQTITSVKYDDSGGMEQLLSASAYDLDNQNNPAWVVPVSTGWPSPILSAINAVRIEYVAGWDGLIPPDIKHAILLTVGEFYENRETSADRAHTMLPVAVDRLLWNYRTFL